MTIQAARGLHVDRWGSGPNLVLVHGWGMHGGLLKDFANDLSRDFRVTLLDLPGHGLSPSGSWQSEDVVEQLIQASPRGSHWVGWSLGGLLATMVARTQPNHLMSLTLMASSPCFTERPDWPGVPRSLLEQMAVHLNDDFEGTLKRFVGLQTFGQLNARDLARRIRMLLESRPSPEVGALKGGLDLLLERDLRLELAAVSVPVFAVLGGLDRLVPIAVSDHLRLLRPGMNLLALPGAAHLPFLTHGNEVVEFIRSALRGVAA